MSRQKDLTDVPQLANITFILIRVTYLVYHQLLLCLKDQSTLATLEWSLNNRLDGRAVGFSMVL